MPGMDPRIDAPDEDPELDTWTCDACGASARYLVRDPWIDQDGRRLCGRCAAPGPERNREGNRPSEPEPEPTLAGICDVCGAPDDAVFTVETSEAEILTLCEGCFEKGEGR